MDFGKKSRICICLNSRNYNLFFGKTDEITIDVDVVPQEDYS